MTQEQKHKDELRGICKRQIHRTREAAVDQWSVLLGHNPKAAS